MCVHIQEFAPEHTIGHEFDARCAAHQKNHEVTQKTHLKRQLYSLCVFVLKRQLYSLCVSIFMSSRQSTLAVMNSMRVALLIQKNHEITQKAHLKRQPYSLCVLVLKRQLAVK